MFVAVIVLPVYNSMGPIGIFFKDRLNRTFGIKTKTGITLSHFLNLQNIPINATICRNKGKIVTEDHIITEGDILEIEMVRFYDLPTILSKKRLVRVSKNPIYSKQFISFKNGEIERKIYNYNKEEIKEFVESIFLNFVLENQLIKKGDKIAVGFSGGKDSLALLLLLDRLKAKLPKFKLTAITVAGWEDLTSFEYTKKICNKLDIEQIIVHPKEIEEIFNLKNPLFDTLNVIDKNKKERIHTIYFLHQFMRRGIEESAKKNLINKIFLGLNLEDLFSSFLGFFTTGYEILDLPQRKIGKLTFAFPLFPLTKKEIGLYIYITAKEFSRQGPTTTFDKGPLSRGFYYFVSDKLQDIWPGIEHHVLEGFKKINSRKETPDFSTCYNCKTLFLFQGKDSQYCDVCSVLKSLNLRENKD